MKWLDAGIILINQICHPSESRIHGQQEITGKFGIRCNFLEALTVRTSIPYEWRMRLTENYLGDIYLCFEIEINKKHFNVLSFIPRKWYEEMTRALVHTFNRALSWSRYLNLADTTEELDWNNIFSIPYRTTRETKMLSFCYKLIYWLTPCNK